MKGRTGAKPIALVVEAKPQAGVEMDSCGGAEGKKHGGKVSGKKPSKRADKFARGGAAKNWIAGATKNKGALHRALDVPEGKKIPAKKLAKASHSENPRVRKEASLAKTLKKMH